MWIKTKRNRLVEVSQNVVIQTLAFKPDWIRLVAYLGADPRQSPVFLASAKETAEGTEYIEMCYDEVERHIVKSLNFCDLTAIAEPVSA